MKAEFQAILLAGGEGDRLYPLSDDIPKALLPVGNVPLIHYCLVYLERAGFKEVIVVVTKRVSQKISRFFMEIYKTKMNVILETIEDETDSADALRAAHKYIQTDFVVMSCDLVMNVPLHQIVNTHRKFNPAVTLLLKEEDTSGATPSSTSSSSTSVSAAKDPLKPLDYVGIDTETNRIAFLSSGGEVEKELQITHTFLQRWPNVTFTTNYSDMHFYVFSKWVIDYLKQNASIHNIKYELIPQLINKQFTNAKTDPNIPKNAFEHSQQRALDMSALAMKKFYHKNGTISTSSSNPSMVDAIKCFAFVFSPSMTNDKQRNAYCKRAMTLMSYMEVNLDIGKGDIKMFQCLRPKEQIAGGSSSNISSTSQIGKDCVVGIGLGTGDHVVLKKSHVGKHCKFGNNTKIISSIVMDHVTIGENCTIQHSIICNDSHVPSNTILRNCQVGSKYRVEEGEFKNEMMCHERE